MKRIVQKHGKIIMAILGVILMIVFALPSFTGRNGDNSGVKVGTLDGKKVTMGDLMGASTELDLLTDLLQEEYFKMNMPVSREAVMASLLGVDPSNPRLHWFLMVKEASRWGYDSIPASESMIDASAMNGLLTKYPGLKHSDVVTAMKHYSMVQMARGFVRDFPVSIPALERAADQNQTNIKVAYALFDAADGWQSTKTFSEDDIKKQFDLYKSVIRTPLPSSDTATRAPEPPEINGHKYPFGYKHPDRVKLEYMIFDRAAFQAKSGITIEDQKAAAAEFNKQKKKNPALEYTDDLRAKLEGEQVAQRLTEQMKALTDRAMTRLSEPWKASDSVPADKWVKYQEVADELAPRPEDVKPEVKTVDQWTTQEDLAKLPGIGKAFFRSETNANGDITTFKFPELALHVKELLPPPATKPAEKSAPRAPIDRLGLQVGAEGRLLTDDVGNFYIYRVTAVQPSHEATLEEARSQVIDDLKMLEHYTKLLDDAKAFAEKARKADLMALAAAEKPPLFAKKTTDFSQLSQDNPDLMESNIRGLVKAAFSLVPPVSKAPHPVSQPPTTAAADAAATQAAGVGDTTSFADETALRAYALQLISVRPVNAESFGSEVQSEIRNGGGTLIYAAHKDAGEAFAKYFTLDSLMAREKYTPE